MTSPAFPLLRLPHVAQANIFNLVDPNELLHISLCSKKVHNLSKALRCKQSKIPVCLTVHESVTLNIMLEAEPPRIIPRFLPMLIVSDISMLPPPANTLNTLKIGVTTVPVLKDNRGYLETFWVDMIHGFNASFYYIMQFFDCSSYNLYVIGEEACSDPCLDILLSSPYIMKRCQYERRVANDADLLKIMNHGNLTKSLILHVLPSQQFSFNRSFPWEEVSIHNGHWVTLNNLLTMRCRWITLSGAMLSNDHINEFIRNWLTGVGAPQLKYMLLETAITDFDNALLGLEGLRVDENVSRTYTHIDNIKLTIHGGFEIKRDDGVTATLLYWETNELVRNVEFHFLVWPDFAGNNYSMLRD